MKQQPPKDAPDKPFIDARILRLQDTFVFEISPTWTRPDTKIFEKDAVIDYLAQTATDARVRLRRENGIIAPSLKVTAVFAVAGRVAIIETTFTFEEIDEDRFSCGQTKEERERLADLGKVLVSVLN